MATIQIRVDGDQIQDHVLWQSARFTAVADGNPGSATIVVNNTDRVFAPDELRVGRRLELFVDGEREWDGWIMALSRGWPFPADETTFPDETPRFWTISGVDRNVLFQKRVMFKTSDPSDNRGFRIWPAGTNDSTAIEFALDNYVDLSGDGLSLDIDTIDSPSPEEEFTLGFVSAPMGMLFEDCSEMTGGVYWIGPDRTIHYKSDTDVTAPWVLSDNPTGSQRGYRDVNASLDFSECATQAIVFGAGRGSADPVMANYTNTGLVDTYGRWQWSDLYIGAWKQGTVNRRARTYVNGSSTHRRGHGRPVPVVECTIFEPGIRAGMVVDFRLGIFDYQQNLPVRKVEISFPTDHDVQYDLNLSLKVDTPFGVPDPWWGRRSGDDPDRDPRNRIPPGGTGSVTEIIETEGESNLIDHFDQTAQWWTHSVVDPLSRSEWSIVLPEIPEGGLEVGDVIIVSWTSTAEPTDSGIWGPPPDHAFDLSTAPVRAWNPYPTTFTFFTALTGIGVYEASQFSYFLRITDSMTDLIGQTQPDIRLHTESALDTTKVGYVSVVLRGTVGLPGTKAVMPGIGATVVDTGFSWGEDIIKVDRLDDDLIRDSDDIVFMAFIVFAGINATGFPSVVGQTLSSSTPAVGTGNPVTFDPDGTYAIEEINPTATSDHPAFALAVGRRPSGSPDDFVGPYLDIAGGPLVSNVSTTYSTTHWGFAVGTIPYQTPGPEITGAPWEGTNKYYVTYSTLAVDESPARIIASNSIVRSTGLEPEPFAGMFRLELYDSEKWVLRPSMFGFYEGEPFFDAEVGDQVDYGNPAAFVHSAPFSGFSSAFWSNNVTTDAPEILIKWRFTGPTFTTEGFQIDIGLFSIPENLDPTDVWTTEVLFYIEQSPQIQMWGNGSDAPDNTYPTWPGQGNQEVIIPYHAYWLASKNLEPNVWYYSRIRVGGPIRSYGYPYTAGAPGGFDPYNVGLNLAMSKTWPVDEGEPDATVNSFEWYWQLGSWDPEATLPIPSNEITSFATGWDLVLPQNWSQNFNGDVDIDGEPVDFLIDVGINWLQIFSSSEYFEFDAIWASGVGTPDDSSALLVSEHPLFTDEEDSGSGAGTYRTSMPYKPRTLVIWFEGIKLREGIDYVEVNPEEGTFRIRGDRDFASSITVRFRREGTDRESLITGRIYRPHPVLQYGWGTRLDGYNCTMASACMALDRHTEGAITAFRGSPRATPPNMRSFQNDQSGGTDLFDVRTAWSNGWGETFHNPGTHSWSEFVSKIREGRGAILQGLYGNLPAGKRFSDSFTGGHAIYINEELASGKFWGIDPLYRYPTIYTPAMLQDYAVGLFSAGRVSAGFTRITE